MISQGRRRAAAVTALQQLQGVLSAAYTASCWAGDSWDS